MRNISCALTTPQILAKTKDVPAACAGTFRDDGAHCRWNLQANAI